MSILMFFIEASGIVRCLDTPYANLLVIEQLPADVLRHHLLHASIEVAAQPTSVELVLHVGIILSQHRLPTFLALPQLGLLHARIEQINPFDAEKFWPLHGSPALVLEHSSGIEFQHWLEQSRLAFHLVLPLRTGEMQIQTLLADTVALVGSFVANMHSLGPRLAHTA